MTPARLALREIRRRPLRAGLFAGCVALGAAVQIGLAGFSAAALDGIRQNARELWAADVTVEGTPGLLDDVERWAAGRWPGLRRGRTVNTVSMVRAAGTDRVVSATVEGLSPGYPLYGEIATASGRPLGEALARGVVAAPKLLTQLRLRPGDRVVVNRTPFRIADTLAARTDAPASFFEFAPSLLMDLDRLNATGLLGPGSRSLNKLYLNAPEGVGVDALVREVRVRASAETTEVRTWTTDNPGVFRFLRNTVDHLRFLALLVMVLGGVGVASALQSALGAAIPATGMMRALGAPPAYLLRQWGVWCAVLLATGLGAGLLLGRGVSHLLTRLFGDMIPVAVRVGFPGAALLESALLAGAVAALFAFLPLTRLNDIAPNVVLSWNPGFQKIPAGRAVRFALVALPVFFGLAVRALGRIDRAPIILAALALLGGGAYLLVQLAVTGLERSPLPGRTLERARRGLRRRGAFQTAATVSLALALSTVLALALTQKNLSEQFVKSFPDNTPNVFFMNLQKEQIPRFRGVLGLDFRLFPLIRGRVVTVNGAPVGEVARRGEGDGDRLTREFGLTFGPDLLPTDTVVAGGALWDDRIAGPQVSGFIEHGKRFGLRVGDRLVFNVLGRKIEATVSSLRAIDQTVRQPFFYFYFRPGALEAVPYTLLGGVHLPSERVGEVQRALGRELPNVTTIDLTEVARLSEKVLKRLARVVNAVGAFAFGAGLLLLVSGLLATLPDRRREAALYRALGASSESVVRIFFAEFLLRGGVAAAAAGVVGGAAAVAFVRGVLDLPFRWDGAVLAWTLLGAPVLLALLGLAVCAPALRPPPMEVLRYE